VKSMESATRNGIVGSAAFCSKVETTTNGSTLDVDVASDGHS